MDGAARAFAGGFVTLAVPGRAEVDTSGKSLKGAFFWKFSCYIKD